MPRPPEQPPRDAINPFEIPAYDAVLERQAALWQLPYGDAGDYWGAMLNSPTVCAVLSQGSRAFRGAEMRGALPNKVREFTDLIVGKTVNWNHAFLRHVPDAIANGARVEAVRALLEGREDDLLPEERRLVDYTRAVIAGEVTDDQYAEMEGVLGERGVIEYSAFIAWILMTARLMQALGLAGPTDADLEESIEALATGRVALPDAHEHQR